MAILLNPECRDDEHAKCPNVGLEDETGKSTYCPCHCHEGNTKCGNAHEAPGLAYLGPCVMGALHDGPHHFNGPIPGTVISVTVSEGPAVTPAQAEGEPAVGLVLEGLRRALQPHTFPDNRPAPPRADGPQQ